MSDHQGQFVWVELLTSDLEGATRFYKSVVGWDTQDMTMPAMTYRIVCPKGSATGIGGMMKAPPEVVAMGVPPNWSPYIASRDVDADTARAAVLGGSIYKPPEDIPEAGRFAVIGDPVGAAFNLFKPSMAGEPPVPGGEGSVGWYELHSRDWQKTWPFYASLFGWQKSRAVDMGPLGTYQLFQIDGQDRGGLFNSPAAAQRSFWLMYFTVGDIDAAARRVVDAGGKILHEPVQVPTGGWILQAADPQGAMFALLGTRKG